MKLFSKKNKPQSPAPVKTAPSKPCGHPFGAVERYTPMSSTELELYSSLREAVPIIDGAICKLVRLLGSFQVCCEDKRFESELQHFADNVKCTGGNKGLYSFICTYFDQLLTYGTAVGEMIPTGDMKGVWGLYNASLHDVDVKAGESPLETVVCLKDAEGTPVESQALVFSSLLSPEPGSVRGNSILKGLPFVSSILLKILSSIGTNWERAGNIRYAVTYNPGQNPGVNAKKRAQEIAEEWSRAMRDDRNVCDFVSVGDVSIKVIGADSQILDCDVPIKRITEQIVAKLSIPPFLLGLSWSSTERMSSVQADILTSEIEYYRAVLTPVITKICEMHLRLLGCDSEVSVIWSNISLQDETNLSQARLNNARAMEIESKLEVTP
ncbi:MAG: serine/threonine protein phosphatase [Eubacteriales bacterium]|nr:serine/threonine protein phosphatase [Eubacteriales bacterium]